MKVRSSIKSLKNRHRDCQVVKRRGRIYVINKTDPRFKARAGQPAAAGPARRFQRAHIDLSHSPCTLVRGFCVLEAPA